MLVEALLAGLVLARFWPFSLCVVCAGRLLGESILLRDEFVEKGIKMKLFGSHIMAFDGFERYRS